MWHSVASARQGNLGEKYARMGIFGIEKFILIYFQEKIYIEKFI